ncbi:MAG: DUF4040 domain-containing protein [Chromatiaceae bacterium]|jgi:uncharacterized MnhB-related membrane protein|nr:DUF4040 domain-containing protein [Chromatiaceae bacterium]
MDPMTLLTLLICAGILFGAVAAVSMGNVVSAVIAAGLTSLFAAVTYVILSAPDVAMTEASIGSGLSTAIFLYAINRTRRQEHEKDD